MLALYHSRAAQLRAMEYWSHGIGFKPLDSLRAAAEPGARVERPTASRCWVPSSLRSSAPAQLCRWAARGFLLCVKHLRLIEQALCTRPHVLGNASIVAPSPAHRARACARMRRRSQDVAAILTSEARAAMSVTRGAPAFASWYLCHASRSGHRGNSHRFGFGAHSMPCVAHSCPTLRSSGRAEQRPLALQALLPRAAQLERSAAVCEFSG